MIEILSKITDLVETYESGAYKDLAVMHREITCNMYFLTIEQVQANVRWNQEYYNHSSTVNAVKERHADKEVPELYMIRKVLEGAKGVSIAMGYEIKNN
mgnify:CR=1 FL=1|jgi:hypothetical protein|tara:strand:+ start:1373 stop:1669 length:297 start_codon:yes stop_codon:yes gene_type:complete